jgi:hypothetical protein
MREKSIGERGALKHYQLTGDIHVEKSKLDGTISLLVDGADRYKQHIEFPAGYEDTAVKDGRAWTASKELGVNEAEGSKAAQKLRGLLPYRLAPLMTYLTDLQVTRRDTVGGQEALVVRATSKLGSHITMFLDEKTGLTLREDSYPELAGIGTLWTSVAYEDYRPVGAMQIPFRMVSRNPYIGKVVVQFNEVKTDIEVPADAFDLKAPE